MLFRSTDGGQRLLFAVPNVAHTKSEETKVFKFVTLREYGTMDLTGLEFVAGVRYANSAFNQYFLFKEVK